MNDDVLWCSEHFSLLSFLIRFAICLPLRLSREFVEDNNEDETKMTLIIDGDGKLAERPETLCVDGVRYLLEPLIVVSGCGHLLHGMTPEGNTRITP